MLTELEEDELTDDDDDEEDDEDDDDDLIDDDDFLLELEDLEENCSLETDDDELSIIGKSNMSSFFCSDCLLFLRINISASNPVIIITTKIIASVEKPLFRPICILSFGMFIFRVINTGKFTHETQLVLVVF